MVNAADYTAWRDNLGRAAEFEFGDAPASYGTSLADAIWPLPTYRERLFIN